jgi:coenzyme F420-0:L-glutamate ligase/coenzyme F420-1:gamma-L-glutamate ligase
VQTREIQLFALPGIPEVQEGDDLVTVILEALRAGELRLQNGDVVVVTQKIVSKAEGCAIDLSTVMPTNKALKLAEDTEKDTRLVEVILRQSRQVVRKRKGTLIMETHHGWICANAGVDRSNVPGEDVVLTLPIDPDDSARKLREGLLAATGADIAVIITDTHGRPWRLGTVNLAIGVDGMQPLIDYRGAADRNGYILRTTTIARADELAAAAGLISGQADEGLPVVLIRGARYQEGDGPARDLQRPVEKDLFR